MYRLATLAIPVLALSACDSRPSLVGPADDPPILRPALSVAVFDITDLLGPGAAAFGLNAQGQIVGYRRDGGFTGFLWTNGSELGLGDGTARDVNDQGVVAISAGPSRLWQNGVTTEIMGGLPRALNSEEEVVGVVQLEGTTDTVPAYWSNPTVGAPAELDVDGLDGDHGSAPDINSVGQIVGSFGTTPLLHETVPLYWESGLAAHLVLSRGGGVGGEAKAINDAGQIVGTVAFDVGPPLVAVLWPAAGDPPLRLLGPDGISSHGLGLNDLGQVVGWAEVPLPESMAMLWMEGEVFPLGGPPGIRSMEAVRINNMGEVVGNGRDTQSGEEHALRWIVPILARVDIDPSSASNALRLDGKGRVSIAIRGSRWFNASTVDPGTLTLGNDDGSETPIARKKKLTAAATLTDQNRDGYQDLVAEFEEKRLMQNGDLGPGATRLVLLGRLQNGRHIRGSDVVQVVP